MCMLLYLGSRRSLQELPWNQERPAFHVDALRAEKRGPLLPHFSGDYLYVVGSAEKCACAFEAGLEHTPEETRLRDESFRELFDYLSGAVLDNQIELFACEAGDEGKAPTQRIQLSLAEVGAPDQAFVPLSFIRIVESSDASTEEAV